MLGHSIYLFVYPSTESGIFQIPLAIFLEDQVKEAEEFATKNNAIIHRAWWAGYGAIPTSKRPTMMDEGYHQITFSATLNELGVEVCKRFRSDRCWSETVKKMGHYAFLERCELIGRYLLPPPLWCDAILDRNVIRIKSTVNVHGGDVQQLLQLFFAPIIVQPITIIICQQFFDRTTQLTIEPKEEKPIWSRKYGDSCLLGEWNKWATTTIFNLPLN